MTGKCTICEVTELSSLAGYFAGKLIEQLYNHVGPVIGTDSNKQKAGELKSLNVTCVTS